MKAALLQISSSDDPAENCAMVSARIRAAAQEGAQFVLTPEVTNCVSGSRTHQAAVLRLEEDDRSLSEFQKLSAELGIWLLIGSLALKTNDADGRFANRSFLIDPTGSVAARYDKIHMFDVEVSESEVYRESAGYRPGTKAVVCQTPFGKVGMSICYDVRFAYLYRSLAQAGAGILTIPSAFSPVTGAAHWDALLRARAIETGSYVLAPAQCGQHRVSRGASRETYGHSMVISPWGEILADAGKSLDTIYVEIDINEVAKARGRISALQHDRSYESPT